jgi:signal peptidase I
VDGHAITVRRLPGVLLPPAPPDTEAPDTLPRPHHLHLVRRVGQLALNFLLVAMMASVLVLLGPALLGYQRYVILTGSMTGTYDRGSVVFDRPVATSSLKVGDPITYSPPHGYTSQQRVTHRIWWIGRGPNGERVFRTKGDANKHPDAWKFTLDQATQDRAFFHLPDVGYVFIVLSLRAFRIALIGLPAIVIGLFILRGLWREAGTAARREKLAELGWQESADSGAALVLTPLDGPTRSPMPVRLELHLPSVGASAPVFSRSTSRPSAPPSRLHVRRLTAFPQRRGHGDAERGGEKHAHRAPDASGAMVLRVARLRPDK